MSTYYVNPNSSAGGDGTTSATTGANRAYNSLADFHAARAGDLVTATDQMTVICGGNARDTGMDTATAWTGWTTNATYYLEITSDASNAASTEWNTGKYYVMPQSWGAQYRFDIKDCIGIRVHGLQLGIDIGGRTSAVNWATDAFRIGYTDNYDISSADIRVYNNHLRLQGAADYDHTGQFNGFFSAPADIDASPVPLLYIYNNVVNNAMTGTYRLIPSGSQFTGIRLEHRTHTAYIHNNTICGGMDYGVHGFSTDRNRYHYLKNNAFQDCTDVCNDTTGTSNQSLYLSSYCGYNLNDTADMNYSDTPDPATTDVVSTTLNFVSSTDFALAASDTAAIGAGVADPDSLGLFTTDINGTSRNLDSPNDWDIGAHEYVSSGPSITSWTPGGSKAHNQTGTALAGTSFGT